MADPIIPDTALDTHIGVLGRTGTGKTFTARGLVERLLDAQRQVVIVDPTGAWWGLRSHYPIPIFGGEHGDIEITDASGLAVAETILSHRTSAIIDLSGLARQSHAAMRRFMAKLIGRLKDRERGAIWLVIDEADEFMPQMLPAGSEQLFGDLKWIVRRGRIAGWRVMMITQRPQDIAKAVLTQIGTLVAHRLTAPQDRKAVEEWVKGHADPEDAKAVLSSLASLQRGEAWVWSPDNALLVRDTMPAIRSFDSGATPDADSGTVEQPALTSIDMTAIRETLEGKSDSQISTVLATDSNRLRFLEGRVADLERENAGIRRDLDFWRTRAEARAMLLKRAREALVEDAELLAEAESLARSIWTPDEDSPVLPAAVPANTGGDDVARSAERAHIIDIPVDKGRSGSGRPDTLNGASPGLNAAARKMLDMLDRIAPARVTWTSLAAMVGNKARGGNFNAARKAMRESGQIIEDGEMVRSAALPAEGMSREQARMLWKEVLSNPAPRMIDALHAHPMSKPDLGAFLGIVPRGGNFNNGVAQLIRNGVAVDRGGILYLAQPLPGESDHA